MAKFNNCGNVNQCESIVKKHSKHRAEIIFIFRCFPIPVVLLQLKAPILKWVMEVLNNNILLGKRVYNAPNIFRHFFIITKRRLINFLRTKRRLPSYQQRIFFAETDPETRIANTLYAQRFLCFSKKKRNKKYKIQNSTSLIGNWCFLAWEEPGLVQALHTDLIRALCYLRIILSYSKQIESKSPIS